MTNSNPAKLMFLMCLILGTFISISSNSWFTTWLGLELNLMAFIPLISTSSNPYSSESALKYFLIQALGSAVILISASLSSIIQPKPLTFILLALLLKMGAAPVHFWFPPVVQGMSWPQCLLLMTIQKIAPMVLISYTIMGPASSFLIIMSSVLSSMVGAIGGLNQTLLRKILAYSSINHMAWMLAAISTSSKMWITYMLVYSLILSSLVMILNINQAFHFKQLSSIPSTPMKMISFLSLFSLGGLPPFLGFIPKLMVIKLLCESNEIMWLLFLLSSALLTLFYYTRISLSIFTLSSPKFKTSIFLKVPWTYYSLSFVNFTPLLFPVLFTFQL
uniref:NADH-ubiquinone oxidoreductase chain 2 n=1 Tax=Leptalpheus forceps TaxID=576216 RepID=A0A6B9PPH5_9EUCA|nr:NADH dehydrogenase subunit 2 [Leptalpheus forceps]